MLAVGAKYWSKQGSKCLCEEQKKERLFSLGILGSESRKFCIGHLDPSLFQYFTPTASKASISIYEEMSKEGETRYRGLVRIVQEIRYEGFPP